METNIFQGLSELRARLQFKVRNPDGGGAPYLTEQATFEENHNWLFLEKILLYTLKIFFAMMF